MSKITDAVNELALPVIEGLGLILWDIEFGREGTDYVLRVVIDSPDGGVTIDMCEAVSRALDPLLDKADPIPHSYNFEVSSAGLERRLIRQSDFDRFIGHLIEITFYKQQNGIKELLGTLVSRDDMEIAIQTGEELKKLEMKDVANVRLRI